MKARVRLEQIDSILNSKRPDDATMVELEIYIADLEAKQPDRPSEITRCLEKVELHHSAEAMASLEAYITHLEANQQIAAPPNNMPSSRFDPENPPRWSHQRLIERAQRRRVRALKKQNNSWKPIQS